MTMYVFDCAEDALKWAVEVIRRRRLPKIGSFWREIEAEAEWVEQAWEGKKSMSLPTDPDERLSLALRVMDALDVVGGVSAEAARVLKLWAWGDWVDEGRLRAALAIQEKCRREGVRVRLAYRYSYAQLGVIMGCDKKLAWRRVQEALSTLADELVKNGVMASIESPVVEVDNFKKDIYFYEFN